MSCNFFGHTDTNSSGYEEEPSDNYYDRDDNYSPSPPHASGGSYNPQAAHFEPGAPHAGFTQHPNVSIPNVAQPPIPPYNPADYANQPPTHDPYGYPPIPKPGDNVSLDNNPHQFSGRAPTSAGATNIPYFPPPPTSPIPEQPRNEEGAS
jgi:hypothetical protein